MESSRYRVFINPELEDIIPSFLKNREKDVLRLTSGIEAGDFELIRTVGHDMKGTGAGYGFSDISVIGDRVEKAALKADLAVIQEELKKLKEYLSAVEVIYKEPEKP